MKVFKAMIFYPMLFVRTPFIAISRIIGILLILFFILTLLFGEVPWTGRLFAIGLAFGLFLLRHFYDIILLKLNPSDSELTLYQ